MTVAGKQVVQAGMSVMLPVSIFSTEARLLIDTGAEITILSKRIYDEIPAAFRPRLKQPKCKVTLAAANDGIMGIEGVADINMETEGEVFVWQVFVANIKEDGLLGMDFLYANDFVLSADGGLKLKGKVVKTEAHGVVPNVLNVSLTEDVTIRAYCECVLNGSAPTKELNTRYCIVEALPELAVEDSILIGSTLVDAWHTDIGIPLRVMNTGNEDVLIHKGTNLATIQGIEDICLLAEVDNTVEDCQERLLSVCRVHCTGQTINKETVPPVDESKWPESVKDLFARSTTQLSESEKVGLGQVLNKHINVFAKSPQDIGHTSVVCHTIDTGGAKPIKQLPRRPPRAFANEEEKIIRQQLEAGIIEESTSAWSSPMVYVRKKDNTVRPCVDYRILNSVTEKDAYPLPRIDDCLDCLGGAKVLSTLDLQSGYWQISVAERDRPKTAFITRSGLYQYRTMPFGLTNAPSTFT